MHRDLKKFLSISNFLLTNCNCIADCLVEGQRTSTLLTEICQLCQVLERRYLQGKQEFDRFISLKRVEVMDTLKRKGFSVTQQMTEDYLVKFFEKDYTRHRTSVERRKTDMDFAHALKMAMFQRKDLVMETIALLRTNVDHDSCIVKNSEFIRKIMEAR